MIFHNHVIENKLNPHKLANRIKELDYLKAVLIVLMIVFHLVYISEKYPYAKNVVYTFHMPAFLIISGYLVNTLKKTSIFFRDMLWIFIPYLFMEISYIGMSSILPVRDAVENITPSLIAYKVFIAPMGPYWYLHTLIICSIINFVTCHFDFKNNSSQLIILGLSFFFLSYVCKIISFENAIYFLIGTAISRNKISFTTIFQPSGIAIIPLVILCSFPDNLNRGTLSGVVITYLCISLFLYIHKYLKNGMRQRLNTIGKNTFVILLFSPIFTIVSKKFIPFFFFDPSGIFFMIVAVIFVITGCLLIAFFIDRLRLTKICFGKSRILILDDPIRYSKDN